MWYLGDVDRDWEARIGVLSEEWRVWKRRFSIREKGYKGVVHVFVGIVDMVGTSDWLKLYGYVFRCIFIMSQFQVVVDQIRWVQHFENCLENPDISN